jgi:hypothetical protein
MVMEGVVVTKFKTLSQHFLGDKNHENSRVDDSVTKLGPLIITAEIMAVYFINTLQRNVELMNAEIGNGFRRAIVCCCRYVRLSFASPP